MLKQAPNDFVVPPALLPPDSTPAAPSTPSSPAKPATASVMGKSLLDRYGLVSRVAPPTSTSTNGLDKGKAKEAIADAEAGAGTGTGTDGETLGEKGKWEASKEARERGLRERKERMILEARR